MSQVDVTVIVCTYNRAEFLRQALTSLIALETEGRFCYEVLVVDNGSTDHTPQVISEVAQQSGIRVRGVREAVQNISAARNRGIREASGVWIAFFDDDQLADRHWLAELWAWAAEKQVCYVAGQRRLHLDEAKLRGLPPLCRRILGELAEGDQPFRYSGPPRGSTGNVLIHRCVFERVGLFDESLWEAGEDADLNRRVGEAKIEAWYTPAAWVYHLIPAYRLQADYFRWTCRRHGVHLAWRERNTFGAAAFPLLMVARVAQAVLAFLPALLWAWCRKTSAETLQAQCRLWRAEGYLRAALRLLAPRLFAQEDFCASLHFRSERERFLREPAGEAAKQQRQRAAPEVLS